MSTLVGKRICFEEELNGPRDSSVTDYKRSIRKVDKIESLVDVKKKISKRWAISMSQQCDVPLLEIQTMLEQNDYNTKTVDDLLKERPRQQIQQQSTRQMIHAPFPEVSQINQELASQATYHLFENLQSVQNINQAHEITFSVFEKIKQKLSEQNSQLEVLYQLKKQQIKNDNKTLKQGFYKQFQKTQKQEEKYQIDSKEHQQMLTQQEDEIRKLQLANKTLTVFLKQGLSDEIYNQ